MTNFSQTLSCKYCGQFFSQSMTHRAHEKACNFRERNNTAEVEALTQQLISEKKRADDNDVLIGQLRRQIAELKAQQLTWHEIAETLACLDERKQYLRRHNIPAENLEFKLIDTIRTKLQARTSFEE